MPSGRRPTSRPSAGPGRGKPRARTQAGKQSASRRTPNAAVGQQEAAPLRRRSYGLTARAVALVVVLLILTISYVTSLRIYFSQAHEISATQAEIAERQQRIGELRGELARWNDEAYVRTQARERLGWVVPGETGYTVVDADGKPLGGGARISTEASPEQQPDDSWWARLWGSVEAADRPAPAKDPAEEDPVTVRTKPNR